MPSTVKDFKQFFDFCKENEVTFVDFRFTDLCGQWHHITRYFGDVSESNLKEGFTFDGSSIKGWKSVEDSDMFFVPDISSFFLDPFAAQSTAVLFCDVHDSRTGAGYDKDPRTVAKLAEKYFTSQKIGEDAFFGPEPEFFIFDDVRYQNSGWKSFFEIGSSESPFASYEKIEGGNNGFRPLVKGGYFPVTPIDNHNDIRSEMVGVMNEIGLRAQLHHHEVASAQNEIGFLYSTLTQTADNTQKYKYVVKNVAQSFGKTATFMPKPIFGDNGSGMHVHQSIWDENVNTFKGDLDAGLSEKALFYIGGIIKHAKAINAFTNPTTNSYKRLVPGYEAPEFLAYSARNRSASIRIPYATSANARRIEVRFPDPLANPYFAFSAMLMAGIDGIKNKIHPGKPTNENLYELSEHEQNSIPRVASSLDDALNHLEKDCEFLRAGGVFSDDLLSSYISIKRDEAKQNSMRPTPFEFENYYNS